jgi:hypothetical protein
MHLCYMQSRVGRKLDVFSAVKLKLKLVIYIPLFPTLDVLQERFTELWQLAGKTNERIYGTAPTAALQIYYLLATQKRSRL